MNNLHDKEIERKLSKLERFVESGEYNEFFAAFEAFQKTVEFNFLKPIHHERLASLIQRAMYRKNFVEGIDDLNNQFSNNDEKER